MLDKVFNIGDTVEIVQLVQSLFPFTKDEEHDFSVGKHAVITDIKMIGSYKYYQLNHNTKWFWYSRELKLVKKR